MTLVNFFSRKARIQVRERVEESDWREKDVFTDADGKFWRILVGTGARNLFIVLELYLKEPSSG